MRDFRASRMTRLSPSPLTARRARSQARAAFYDCGALETVTLGNSVRKIRGYAFFRCAGFDHIELPKSLVHIEEYAFYGCSALESILYNGTPNDWMKVTVEDGNYPFQDTQIGMTMG